MVATAGFWIVRTHVTRATLYSTGTKIDELPVQSDMAYRQWWRPGNEADVVIPEALVLSMDDRRWNYGKFKFKWPLRMLSPKMTSYLFVTLWQEQYNGDFTVQTWNRGVGEWETFQCIGNFPPLWQATLAGGGYDEAVIEFVDADRIESG